MKWTLRFQAFRLITLTMVFSLSCLIGLLGQLQISEWKIQEANDATCSIYSPSKMEMRIDSLTTDIGQIFNVHHFLRQSTETSPNFLFQMSYTLYPENVIPQDSVKIIEELLETTVDNAVLMQNAALLYKAEKSFKDYPGMIWKTSYGEGKYVMKSEIYFANNHLYMIQVGSLAGAPLGEAVDHFFNSFKIN